ncbi:MAG: hypothetical protein RIC14_14310 [Filomicrobium sp.]
MIRKTLAAAVVSLMAIAPAHAADCITNYQDFWEKISGDAKVSTETLVSINRTALRAFDACQSGDEGNFGAGFWTKMSQYGEVKDAAKFWEELSQYGEAKK